MVLVAVPKSNAILDLELEGSTVVDPKTVVELEGLTVLLFATVINGAVPGVKRAVLDFSAKGIYLSTPHMIASLYTVLAIKAVLDAS